MSLLMIIDDDEESLLPLLVVTSGNCDSSKLHQRAFNLHRRSLEHRALMKLNALEC